MRAWEKVVLKAMENGDVESEYYWVDKDTGLMWQKEHEDISYQVDNVNQASEKLNKENFGGFNDWRVPTFDELKTILLKEEEDGKYIKKELNNSLRGDGIYWPAYNIRVSGFGFTNILMSNNTKHVNFSDGNDTIDIETIPHYVRCVRGGHQ